LHGHRVRDARSLDAPGLHGLEHLQSTDRGGFGGRRFFGSIFHVNIIDLKVKTMQLAGWTILLALNTLWFGMGALLNATEN